MNLAALTKQLKRTHVSADDQHDLIALATVNPSSIGSALHLWEENAPAELVGLLVGSQGWHWDATTQTYRHQSGRTVGGEELKELSVAVAAALKKKQRAALLLVLMGSLPILAWRHQIAVETSALYVMLAALGSGGVFRITPSIERKIIGKPNHPPGLAYTLARLRNFARVVEEKQDQQNFSRAMGMATADTMSPLTSRMGLYVDAAQTIYEEARRQSHVDQGRESGRLLLERNILGEADHCHTTDRVVGCPEWTAQGWVAAGTMTPPGCRPCSIGCKCRMEFRFV